MKFSINRDALLKPLSLAVGVIENRHTLPILSNVLLSLKGNKLTLVGTDAEIEISAHAQVEEAIQDGDITLPAKKLLDIVKSLSSDKHVMLSSDDNKVSVTSGKSRFVLSSMPASDFPVTNQSVAATSITLSAKDLGVLIDSTAFAMAQQDVRYFLNGMLWELDKERFRVVATDGHRLAMCDLDQEGLDISEKHQMIVPYKGIQELSRLMSDEDELSIGFNDNNLRVETPSFVFTSKLIDGKFPDYQRVLPQGTDKVVLGSRQQFKESFSRVAILSNEKFKGVRLEIKPGEMLVSANNPDQEEAEESVQVEYDGDSLEIGFNVKYLIDVFGVIKQDKIKIELSDGNSSALISACEHDRAVYVVMPMRL
ncbi:MAG: DNA polymerase III subunit beta [Pseudomonadota bacterium]